MKTEMKTVIIREEAYRQILAIKAQMEQQQGKCFSMGSVIETLLPQKEVVQDGSR